MAVPWRVRFIRSAARHLPRGQYRLLPFAGDHGQFVASLGSDAGGARFHCNLADLIEREACVTGLYEPPVSRVIQAMLPRGGTFFDVGANWGYFTLLAAPRVGSSGRVLALEPDPRPFGRLVKNLAENAFPQVTVLQAAASAGEGRARLHGYDAADANRGTSRLVDDAGDAGSFDVRCVAVDDLAPEALRVDVVKIDVEGAEDRVLEGMKRGLGAARYRTIVLELHPGILRGRGVDPASCVRTLIDAGYEGWTIDHAPETYRRAIDPSVGVDALLGPLDAWRAADWPHLLWRHRAAG